MPDYHLERIVVVGSHNKIGATFQPESPSTTPEDKNKEAMDSHERLQQTDTLSVQGGHLAATDQIESQQATRAELERTLRERDNLLSKIAGYRQTTRRSHEALDEKGALPIADVTDDLIRSLHWRGPVMGQLKEEKEWTRMSDFEKDEFKEEMKCLGCNFFHPGPCSPDYKRIGLMSTEGSVVRGWEAQVAFLNRTIRLLTGTASAEDEERERVREQGLQLKRAKREAVRQSLEEPEETREGKEVKKAKTVKDSIQKVTKLQKIRKPGLPRTTKQLAHLETMLSDSQAHLGGAGGEDEGAGDAEEEDAIM